MILIPTRSPKILTTRSLKSLTFKTPPPQSWYWVSKNTLPKSVKHFFWITYHGNLPINHFRVWQHISFDASCFRCGGAEENIIHLLRDCPLSVKFGKLLYLIIVLTSWLQAVGAQFQPCISWRELMCWLVSS